MRLLYIINAFSWGGAEKLVYDLSLYIRPKVDFISIVALYKQNDDTEKDMIQDLNDHGINAILLDKPTGHGMLQCINKLRKYSVDNRISLIHAHCSVPMFLGKVVGNVLNIPIICTIHNTRGYNARMERFTAWMASKYVSIGLSAEDYMKKELGIPPQKIVRIYNAIDLSKFKAENKKPNFWDDYSIDQSEIKLLNVARVNEQKNQMCLIKAVKQCLDNNVSVHLYLLGSYNEKSDIYLTLTGYINENNLSNKVTFLGMHKNVNDFINNSDCFVMTSTYEGLSVAFLEAVICEKPIITTDMPFVNELMQIGRCATVIPQNDDSALYMAIKRKQFYPPSLSVVNRFRELFSLETFASKHLDLYWSVTNGIQ